MTVNGQEVAGSPFPVFVSIHPTLLGKPVRAIAGVTYPCDVAVTTTGNIIVANESCGATVFDKSGKKVIDLFGLGMTSCCGVTVDNTDGCIYISDWNTKVIKLSQEL